MDPNLHTPLMSSSSSLYLNDYKLDKPNTALCICTLTGATYARRHWKQSKGSEHPLRHKAMAIVELIPVIGGIAAGIENQVSKKGPAATDFFSKTECHRGCRKEITSLAFFTGTPTIAPRSNPYS